MNEGDRDEDGERCKRRYAVKRGCRRGFWEVRRIDLCRRFANAMPAARDIDNFCKKGKSENWDKCLNK